MKRIEPLARLIESFRALPGIGNKTAVRLAYHILDMEESRARALASAIIEAKDRIGYCHICCNLSDEDPCHICSDEKRDASLLCVVEQPQDVEAVERMKNFPGKYHVLHGALSPLEGIGPENLKVKELLARVNSEGLREVIVATNPNVEGEATAVYLSRLLKPMGVKVTRIAHGLPVGGDLEYADEVTLARAIENRIEL